MKKLLFISLLLSALFLTGCDDSIRTFEGNISGVNSVAFSPDRQLALSGSDDGTIKLWEVNTGQLVRTFSGHTYPVYSVAFSPDGQRALSGSRDNTLKLWEVNTGQLLRTFSEHVVGWIKSVAFSPNGQWALSGGSYDDSNNRLVAKMYLWEVNTGQLIRSFKGHTRNVNSVAVRLR